MKNQKDQKKKVSSGITYIITIIVLLNVLSSVVPSVFESIQGRLGDFDEQRVENLEIVSVSGRPISARDLPERFGIVEEEEGYQTYQFEVTLDNQGNDIEMLRYSLVDLDGVDGYAGMLYEETEENEIQDDTRILPPGRQVTIMVYGKVADETTEVEVCTYRTPDGEKKSCAYQL